MAEINQPSSPSPPPPAQPPAPMLQYRPPGADFEQLTTTQKVGEALRQAARLVAVTFLLLLSISGLFLLFAMILFSVSLSLRRRQIRARTGAMIAQRTVLATQLNQPLATAFALAIPEERGAARRAVLIISQYLQKGADFGAALHAAKRWIDFRTVELLATAEQDGTLPAAARRLVTQFDQRPHRPVGWLTPAYPLYLMMLLGIACFIFSIGQLFVLPKMVQILIDFKRPPTPLQVHLLNLPIQDAALPLTIAFAVILVVSIALMLGGRLSRFTIVTTRNIWGSIAWYTPIAHGIVLCRGLADAMAGAADSVALGRPLGQSAALGANRNLNPVLQRRLRNWTQNMDRGADPASAARSARLPDLVCGMLAPAQRSNALPDTLNFLARYYESRFSRAAEVLRASIDGICITIGAAVVLLVFASTLLPVFQLLDALARNPSGMR